MVYQIRHHFSTVVCTPNWSHAGAYHHLASLLHFDPAGPPFISLRGGVFANSFSGTIANDPTFDELWLHFQAILGGIFGKQDATKGPESGPTSRICGSTTFENSWMFAT